MIQNLRTFVSLLHNYEPPHRNKFSCIQKEKKPPEGNQRDRKENQNFTSIHSFINHSKVSRVLAERHETEASWDDAANHVTYLETLRRFLVQVNFQARFYLNKRVFVRSFKLLLAGAHECTGKRIRLGKHWTRPNPHEAVNCFNQGFRIFFHWWHPQSLWKFKLLNKFQSFEF